MEPRAAVVVAGVAAAAFVYTGHACCTGTLPAPASPEVSDGISEAEVSEWASLLPKKTRLKGKPSAEQAAQLKAQKVEREARQQTLLLALSERLGQPPSALRPKLNQLAKAAKLAAKPKAAPARKPHAQPVPEAEQYSGPPAVPPSKYGASVELLGGPFIGEDMWLGGELAADGNIYGVPGTAKTVVKIDPRTDEVSEVGDLVVVPGAIRGNRFKWLRGARAANGDMFGIPCNANKVLRITSRGEVDMIGDPEMLAGHWKWHGGVLHANGNLYGCPCNSEHVLKIEPNTAKVTLVGGPFPGKQKWYGSLLGGDGCMYCIPNCAGAVLKFDPVTETHELLGDFPEGGWKWHGAAVGGDGNIYGVAAHVNAILKIVVSTGEVKEIGQSVMPEGQKYKWGGAMAGANGDVYCFPSDTERVLKITIGVPEEEQVSLIGPAYKGKNKWQNGFLGRDNAVYGLPCNAETVLRISEDDEVTTIGGPWAGVEKWEGGVMAPSGVIYAMPQQSPHVLRIDPGPAAAAGAAGAAGMSNMA